MKKKKILSKFIFVFIFLIIFFALSNPVISQSTCGYTCGATTCQEEKLPANCKDECPPVGDPNYDANCEVCTSSVCSGNCIASNPGVTYNSNCPATFDWTAGNLNSVPFEVLYQNLDKIGNQLSELSPQLQQEIVNKIIEEYGFEGTIDLSVCSLSGLSPQSCGIKTAASGEIVLVSGGIEISLNSDISDVDGWSLKAVEPKGWQFTVPEGGQLQFQSQGNSYIINSVSQNTVIWDGSVAILSEGTSITYEDSGVGTKTTVYSRDDGTRVYFRTDVPEGQTGVAINCPSCNNDGVMAVGVNAAIAHTTKDGETVGLLTSRMNGNEQVLLKKVANQNGKTTYSIDLTNAGDSKVIFLDGFEGIIYNKESGKAVELYQCNQAAGSCPYDEKTDILLLVTYKDKSGNIKDFKVQGQAGIFGEKIIVCPCDKDIYYDKLNYEKQVGCDKGCVCDIICDVETLPKWLMITFGYENYLKCIAPSGTTKCKSDAGCCRAYGATYKPASGQSTSGPGTANPQSLAFYNRDDSCQSTYGVDPCSRRPFRCRSEDQRFCINTLCSGMLLKPPCGQRPAAIAKFCRIEQGASGCDGYCNAPPYWKPVKLVTNVSVRIKDLLLWNFMEDEQKLSVKYQITSQSAPEVTNCKIFSEKCIETSINNASVKCTTPQITGINDIDIKVTDECGMEGYAISCPKSGRPINYIVEVINATTPEDAEKLGLWEDDVKIEEFEAFAEPCDLSSLFTPYNAPWYQDEYFKYQTDVQKINVTVPSNVKAGTTITIKWKAPLTTQKVDVDLMQINLTPTEENIDVWKMIAKYAIADGVDNTGILAWTVPIDFPTCFKPVIRVMNSADDTVFGIAEFDLKPGEDPAGEIQT